MLPFLLGAALAGFAVSSPAAETHSFPNLNLSIPDGDPSGLSYGTNLTSSAVTNLAAVRVHLEIDGEYNGDLYAYLRHATPDGTNLCILLNRSGRTSANPYGYADSGFDIVLDDVGGQGDIHTYQTITTPSAGQPLTGAWEPDGRFLDPLLVEDTSPRTTSLTDFNGTDANGEWTLFVADVDYGATNGLISWGLEFDAVLPSKPENVVAVGGDGRVFLSWDEAPDAVTYDVKRGDSPGGPYTTTVADGISGTSFIDTGVVNGQTYYYVVSGGNISGDGPDSDEASATPHVVAVEGRWVFYNESAWDSNDPTANVTDDDAIAPDKTALLPGETATFANYTSYSRGLNGIMVDIAGLTGTPTTNDFTFKVGNDNDPSGWDDAPEPWSVTVRPGAGTNGSDRVTLIWTNNNLDAAIDENEAVAKAWLEVTVLANANTGLAAEDVFYFGNAVAEVGDNAANAEVNITDINGVRLNQRSFFNPAPTDFAYDFNRDTFVDITDINLTRLNQTSFFNRLELIDLSQSQVTAASVEAHLPQAGQGAPPKLEVRPLGLGRLFIHAAEAEGRLETAGSLNGPWMPVEAERQRVQQEHGWIVDVNLQSPSRFYRLTQGAP